MLHHTPHTPSGRQPGKRRQCRRVLGFKDRDINVKLLNDLIPQFDSKQRVNSAGFDNAGWRLLSESTDAPSCIVAMISPVSE